MDLGTAEQLGSLDGGLTTLSGGTLHAMSPEMARLHQKTVQGVELDYKKDVVSFNTDCYSLGILVYELLSGTVPYSKGYFYNES